jgi:hypothetical protein
MREEVVNANKRLARTAGLLYLIVGISGGFAQLYVRASVVVPDDAAATADHIADSATLFKVGFLADVVNIVAFSALALLLYRLLHTVNRPVARTFVVFNLAAVAIMGANQVNHFAALLLATEPRYAATLGADSSEALVLFFTQLHAAGYRLGEVFFGLWLLPLGYVVYRSGYFPRALGAMLMVGCFGYLADAFVHSFSPDAQVTALLVGAWVAGVAEIWLMGWLLIKGVKTRSGPARDELAAVPA